MIRLADPGRPQLRRPDARGEADLQSIVLEAAAVPGRARAPRATLRAALVAAVVLALVVGVSAAVLLRPGGDAASPSPTSGAACDPVALQPFLCGRYISSQATKDVSGDRGGVTEDPLTIRFTRAGSGYVLTATGTCFAETVQMRLAASAGPTTSYRLVPTGTPDYGSHGCSGGAVDREGWGYRFLRGPLAFDDGGGSIGVITFRQGERTIVDFAYLGETGTLATRSDLRCVAAHVQPFSCAHYRSVSGTGSMVFLASDRYGLSFDHSNGLLSAVLMGPCNALNQNLEVVGDRILAFEGAQTAMGCGAPAAQHDAAVARFFAGSLRYRIDGNRMTFTNGSATAVFQR